MARVIQKLDVPLTFTCPNPGRSAPSVVPAAMNVQRRDDMPTQRRSKPSGGPGGDRARRIPTWALIASAIVLLAAAVWLMAVSVGYDYKPARSMRPLAQQVPGVAR